MTPDALRPLVPAMAGRAAALDLVAGFPDTDVAALAAAGFVRAPLPSFLGGTGLGTAAGDPGAILGVLRLLGSANPALGRLFEAHVNAIRLILRFGTAAQAEACTRDCDAGHLFGLWVTDAPANPLRRRHGLLTGAKGPCSGAGHLRRALVTVTEDGATRLAILRLDGTQPVDPIGTRLLGMRASVNGTIALDGVPLPSDAIVGQDGDYLREPDFTTGAWRTMAVTVGILDALAESVRQQLVRRGHDEAPLQQARFGELLIARGTAALWTRHAAEIAERGTAPVPDQMETVNLARIATEAAAFDAMRHAQRAIGLAAVLHPNPVERHLRDLATYLRQPAADAVLTEAAQHALLNPIA